MPRVVCNQPKRLKDSCVDYAALNIDDVLKYEEQMKVNDDQMKFHKLPPSLHRLISDKILNIGLIHDGNYQKILSHKTRNIILKKDHFNISNPTEFFEFICENCKFVVKINPAPLLSCFKEQSIITLICKTLSSMDHLEEIDLSSYLSIDDKCLQAIGSKCSKLKCLKFHRYSDVTKMGLDSIAHNCQKLTHLRLKGDFYEIPPEYFTALLILCPELEVLDYRFSGKSVLNAIEDMISVVGSDSGDLDANSAKNPESRSFKLKDLRIDCAKHDFTNHMFLLIQQHCPSLQSLTLLNPSHLESGALNSILHMPLHSIKVEESSYFEPISADALILLQAMGSTLTTLKLNHMSQVDLRRISLECPNLTDLALSTCETTVSHPLPNNESSITLFKFLINLNVSGGSFISVTDLTALLASPNLECVDLCGRMRPTTIPDVLYQYPGAFSKLISLRFSRMVISNAMLGAVLERAVNLENLSVSYCRSISDGTHTQYNATEYVNELVNINNWALKREFGIHN